MRLYRSDIKRKPTTTNHSIHALNGTKHAANGNPCSTDLSNSDKKRPPIERLLQPTAISSSSCIENPHSLEPASHRQPLDRIGELLYIAAAPKPPSKPSASACGAPQQPAHERLRALGCPGYPAPATQSHYKECLAACRCRREGVLADLLNPLKERPPQQSFWRSATRAWRSTTRRLTTISHHRRFGSVTETSNDTFPSARTTPSPRWSGEAQWHKNLPPLLQSSEWSFGWLRTPAHAPAQNRSVPQPPTAAY